MKRLLLILFPLILLFTSCTMEATIPENDQTFSYYLDHKELFSDCVDYLKALDYDALITRNEYYTVEGSENINGLYIQKMSDLSLSSCDSPELLALFENTDVKLVDLLVKEEGVICAFDLCVPGKNFDYGIYYNEANEPIYFGDTALELTPSGNGFIYEKKASYGAKFTYYTEKIEDHIFYYEIA